MKLLTSFTKKSGQLGMATMLSIFGGIAIAIIGGYFSQASRTDAKLEQVKNEQSSNVLVISQRVTAVETDSVSIKNDLREVKMDVKEILKTLRN